MARQKNIFALDLGTTKFCLAKFSPERVGKGRPLEVLQVEAAGMRRGMLSEFDSAKEALLSLIDKVENGMHCDVRSVVVGIAGSHLESYAHEAVIEIEEEVITRKHIQLLQKEAWNSFKIEGRELLHCVPKVYTIDNRAPTDNPEGFSGNFLSGTFLYIHSDRNYLRDVIRLCNQCGLQVDRLFSEPFASSVVTFSEEKLTNGVAIADIGGGTTDGMVFLNGKAERCFTLNIGGKLMTNDIAVGLNKTYEDAESLKRVIDLTKTGTTLFTDKEKAVQKATHILLARIEELAQHFASELIPYKGKIAGGLYLTGGGSLVRGLDVYLTQRLKIPVSIVPPKFKVLTDDVSTEQSAANEFSTILGLLQLELTHQQEHLEDQRDHTVKRYLKNFMTWLKDMA